MNAFPKIVLLLAALFLQAFGSVALAQERVGVVLLHGKNPASNQVPHLRAFKAKLERDGMLVEFPQMPWSRTRYLDGDFDQALQEIAGHAEGLRKKGATRIVVVAHSMGVAAAVGYAARGGDVQALVLFAPGHSPLAYYGAPRLAAVRASIEQARSLVAAGKGNSTETFADQNQGKSLSVRTTARAYLSWFDPDSDAEISVTALRVPATVPVLTIVGDKDPAFGRLKASFVDKLPANPQSRYLQIAAGHVDAPEVGGDEAIAWIRKVAGQP